MREDEYRKSLSGRDLADKTRDQRIYALKRLEKHYETELDQEYQRDGLRSILSSLTYSSIDSREGRENPSRLPIDPDKLRTHLAWYKSHLTDYLRFLGGNSETLATEEKFDEAAEEILEAASQTFGLERDLQAALRQNITQLEDGLSIVDGNSERRVEAGFIDILAQDKEGCPVIIELKAGTSRPEAIAQILAYMSCAAEEGTNRVRGILIAAEHHPRVILAAKAIPNLSLKSYRYRFEFS
ncbi:MAG: DUF91 domain-containing protein [Cereibacter sphaeroides]|uniref:DUF91 domain-containing protein n=1 Tax=Cereibacter sphaeroides TaxID=1063 RepID=A0A2W5SBP4_CERSP|nr:MAG: DUF91 domain-containing protein [Cereibacter sphaeroides]